jgi:hypothetical protein
MYNSPAEIRKMVLKFARKSGYTAALIERDGKKIITSDFKFGDSIVIMVKGKNGMKCDDQES